MKRLFAILATLTLVANSTGALYAADAVSATDTDHLEVTAVATTNVGEAIDLTVKAVAKDGSVVKGYLGTVFVIVDNDNKAKVPYSEGYTFTAADQGQKTFSKGLSFTKEWTFKVVVSDFDKPKIEGNAKVKVGAGDAPAVTSSGELVTITSPDAGSTVGNKNLSVTGTTKKNSKVQLFLNGAKALETQTDDKGSFVFQLKNVDQTDNILSVKVLDGSDKVIGESAKTSVKVGSEGPAFTGITLTGGALKDATAKDTYTAAPGAKIKASVAAEIGLKEVTVAIGETVEVLKEGLPGTYDGEISAPMTPGVSPLDVNLKNSLGKSTLKSAAANVNVQALAVAFKNIKVEKGDKKATFTFDVENEPAEVAKFQFDYATASGAAQKSVTFDKAKIKTASGSYSWYVTGLDIAKYDFQISGVDATGKILTWATSESIEVDMTLGSAQRCMISNVSGMKVSTAKDASTLSWTSIPEAIAYNIYKKDAMGQLVFIEAVKANNYVVNLAAGPVKFDDFAVKAVCADASESKDFSPTTRVKTGPAQIFLMLALSLGLGFIFIRRKKLI